MNEPASDTATRKAMRPSDHVFLSFTPASNYEAARAAVSELTSDLEETGADVHIRLQESAEVPPLGFSLTLGTIVLIAKPVAAVLHAWMLRNRTTIKATSVDGASISIDASEGLVRDLLLRSARTVQACELCAELRTARRASERHVQQATEDFLATAELGRERAPEIAAAEEALRSAIRTRDEATAAEQAHFLTHGRDV